MNKRKIIRFLSIISLIAVIFSFQTGMFASACEVNTNSAYVTTVSSVSDADYAQAQAIVDRANAQIYNEVHQTKAVCDFLVMIGFDGNSPLIKALIDNLVDRTNTIAARAISDCARLGVTVKCEYTQYIIAGNVVLIDPLKTIPV